MSENQEIVGGAALAVPGSPSANSREVSHEDTALLGTTWASRSEAVTDIKYFFTGQGKQALIDPNTKGGRNFKLVCSTRLMAKEEIGIKGSSTGKVKVCRRIDPHASCQAQVSVVKSRQAGNAMPWNIQAKNTNLEHLNCGGKAHVTGREIVKTEAFQEILARNRKAPKKELNATLQGLGMRMSDTTLYRARDIFTKEDEASYIVDFQRLVPYAAAFNNVDINGHGNGTATIHTVDEQVHTASNVPAVTKRFTHATIIFEPNVDLWLEGGQKHISMMDMAHSKHERYKGNHWGFVSSDGDNKTITIAWGLCPVEDAASYKVFLNDLSNYEKGGIKVCVSG